MSILKTIKCDICDKTEIESAPNIGWPKWGCLQGINFNGIDNPNLCPEHLKFMADIMDRLKKEHADGMD